MYFIKVDRYLRFTEYLILFYLLNSFKRITVSFNGLRSNFLGCDCAVAMFLVGISRHFIVAQTLVVLIVGQWTGRVTMEFFLKFSLVRSFNNIDRG